MQALGTPALASQIKTQWRLRQCPHDSNRGACQQTGPALGLPGTAGGRVEGRGPGMDTPTLPGGQTWKEPLVAGPFGTSKGGAQHPARGQVGMESLSLLRRAALVACWLNENSSECVRPSELPSLPLTSLSSGSEYRPPPKHKQAPGLSPSHPSKSLGCPWPRWTLTTRQRALPPAQEACRRWGALFLCEGASL